MRRAYDVAQVRAAEAAMMARLPEGVLMQRAAAGLARVCLDVLGGGYGREVAVLVGSGDNGGDALFAGARLAGRGARVTAIQVSDRIHRDGLAALRRAGGRVVSADDLAAERAVGGADVVIDGMLGIGGRGALTGAAARFAQLALAAGGVRVAADLPSGVDADTGVVAGAAFAADVTVAFGCLKPGLLTRPGRDLAGVVEVIDIGLAETLPSAAPVLVLDHASAALRLPRPGPDSDKYARGVVGLVAGSRAYPGAGVLAAEAAVHAGAGLVRALGSAAEAVVAARPEVVPAEGRVQAWVVGPGMEPDADTATAVRWALDDDVPVVLDAGALAVVAGDEGLRAAIRERAATTVLTPHDGEYARLAGVAPADRLGAARWLADDLGAVVLLKGFATIVAEPGGPSWVNPTGTPWLATAGSGDVLAGLLGALLAAGAPDAPALAAYLHGLAGRLAAGGAPASALAVARALPAAARSLTGAVG